MVETTVPPRDRFAPVMFWAAAALGLAVLAITYASQHEFFYVTQRETQTAVTSYYMAHEGYGLFDYITPIMGYPWAIPMEFPIYQYLTAKLSNPYLSLESAGRLVSLIFFALSLWIAFRLARALGFDRDRAYAFLALSATAPIFLTYSLSFTIETLALFLGLLYLERYVAFERDESTAWLVMATGVGVLAALCKATTWVIFAAVISCLLAATALRRWRGGTLSLKDLALRSAAIVLPLAAGLGWTRYTDAVKADNPLTAVLTSSALSQWVYGTLAQRISPTAWAYFITRSLLSVMGLVGAILPALVLYRVVRERGRLPDKGLLGLALVAFFVGPAIFTNLYFEHDYYIMAGGLALPLVMVALFRKGPPRWLLIALVSSNIATSYLYLTLKQINYDNPVDRHIVKSLESLPPDVTLVVFGAFFDSFIPYHTGNKALQTELTDREDPSLQSALELLSRHNPGVVLSKTNGHASIAEATAQQLGMDARFDLCEGVTVHYRSELEGDLRLEHLDIPALAEARLESFLGEFNRGSNRVVVNLGRKPSLELLYYRHGSLYLFDTTNGFQILHQQRHLIGPKRIELSVETTDPKR